MAVYANGDRVFLEYADGAGNGYGVYHERYILGHLTDAEYAVATPDFDVFIGEIQLSNPDLWSIRIGQRGQLPAGVSPNDVYGFRALSAADEQSLLQEGNMLVNQERAARGLGGGGGGALALPLGVAAVPAHAVVPVGPAPVGVGGLGTAAIVSSAPTVAPHGGIWVLDEPIAGGGVVGDVYVLPPGALVLGSRALVTIGGDECVLKRLEAGVNLKEYAEARCDVLRVDPRLGSGDFSDSRGSSALIRELDELPLPHLAKVVSGPRTAPDWLRSAMRDQGSSFGSRHDKWRSGCGARPSLPMMYEHEVLSQVRDIGLQVDRLNILNLASFEVMVRRLQLHEHAVNENPETPSYEGARHWMGFGDRRGGALIVPSLEAHVAKEWAAEASIMKEKRKAREAKEAMRKNKNPPA